ncbi:MAG: S8 family serine peptidase [Saprospiraceae bacterium]|nr:S8 family serine peptidase [Saprospiraceae bacterium]
MAKGYSLHIGLNAVDPNFYANWEGRLYFAEADAELMFKLARSNKFNQTALLLGPLATRNAVLQTLNQFAQVAEDGDLVMISYSGHGGVIPDLNKDEEDGNNFDETWCCYDGEIIDDELKFLWTKFKAGVRIILFSDSCHSGDIVKAGDINDPIQRARNEGAKFMPADKAYDAYSSNKSMYDEILKNIPTVNLSDIKASIKQFGGCHEDGYSYEGFGNGDFTIAIQKAWNNGSFSGDYQKFAEEIEKYIDTDKQNPEFKTIGTPNPDFDRQTPFKITEDHQASKIDGKNLIGADGPVDLLVSFGKTSKGLPDLINIDLPTHHYLSGEQTIGVYAVGKDADMNTDWDRAHAKLEQLRSENIAVDFIEPDAGSETAIKEMEETAVKSKDVFLHTWPHPEQANGNYMWHLGSNFSELEKTRDSILSDAELMAYLEKNPVRIGHLDTGFFPHKGFMPEKIQIGLAKSFVPGESENLGVDFEKKGNILEQQGHGTATLAILAGPKVDNPPGLEGFKGYIGAIPFAEVIPIRVQDSVALLKTRALEQAIYYAVEQGCEVITMSMAGAPSRRWADAVNYAYEKGVTIVAAAGNSWRAGIRKHLPDYLLYPARFERVIGAAGISYNQQPYVFDANNWEENVKTAGGVDMQGNHGPHAQMWHVMAAYTPNVFWAETGEDEKPIRPHFLMTGGGTSSATPQIAAAAALWIAKHRKELLETKKYTGTWKQVEAVRHALFTNAEKFDNTMYDYIGQGALRAFRSIQSTPAEEKILKESPKAKTPFLPLLSTLFGLLPKDGNNNNQDFVKTEMLALELSQLTMTEPNLLAFGSLDASNITEFTLEERAKLKSAILESSRASKTLKHFIQNL